MGESNVGGRSSPPEEISREKDPLLLCSLFFLEAVTPSKSRSPRPKRSHTAFRLRGPINGRCRRPKKPGPPLLFVMVLLHLHRWGHFLKEAECVARVLSHQARA